MNPLPLWGLYYLFLETVLSGSFSCWAYFFAYNTGIYNVINGPIPVIFVIVLFSMK